MSHSPQDEVASMAEPVDYWPDHIDIEKNDWIFTYNNLTQSISRKDDLGRSEELRIYDSIFKYFYQIMRSLVLKSKGPNGQYREDALPRTFIFCGMLYSHRYFQRESLKNSDYRELSTIIAFITARVLERHRKIEDLVSFHMNYFNKDNAGINSPRYWTLKERLEKLELKVMARLCFDFIIPMPYQILHEFIFKTEEIFYMDKKLDQPTAEKLNKLVTNYFEKAAKTQIYLLYKIEEIVLFLLAYVCVNEQYQISSRFFEKVDAVDSLDIKKALQFYHHLTKLNEEYAQYNPSTGAPEQFNVTDDQLRYIIRDASELLSRVDTEKSETEVVKTQEDKDFVNETKKLEIKPERVHKEKEEYYGKTPGSSRPSTSWGYHGEEQHQQQQHRSEYKSEQLTPFISSSLGKEESSRQPGLTPSQPATPINTSKTEGPAPKPFTAASIVKPYSRSAHAASESDHESVEIHTKSEHTSSKANPPRAIFNDQVNIINSHPKASEPSSGKTSHSILGRFSLEKGTNSSFVGEDVNNKDLGKKDYQPEAKNATMEINQDEKSIETNGPRQANELQKDIVVAIKDAEEVEPPVKTERTLGIQNATTVEPSASVRTTTDSEYNESKNEQLKAKLESEQKRTEEQVKSLTDARVEKPNEMKGKITEAYMSKQVDLKSPAELVGAASNASGKSLKKQGLEASSKNAPTELKRRGTPADSAVPVKKLKSDPLDASDLKSLGASKRTTAASMIINPKNDSQKPIETTKNIVESAEHTSGATDKSRKSFRALKEKKFFEEEHHLQSPRSSSGVTKRNPISKTDTNELVKGIIAQPKEVPQVQTSAPRSNRAPSPRSKSAATTNGRTSKRLATRNSSKVSVTMELLDREKLSKICGYVSDTLSDFE